MQVELKQNKQEANLDLAQYILSFKSIDNSANYQILSALIQENDLILEINSSLFIDPNKQKESYFKELLGYFRNNGLDYTYHKVADNSNKSFFASLFRKDNTAHQAICYLPNNIWKSTEFRSLIPIRGARYYILDKTNDQEILKKMDQLMNSEILEYFQLIIFDPGTKDFQQMGINSSRLSKNELEKLLAGL